MSNKKIFLTTCLLMVCLSFANFPFNAKGQSTPLVACPYVEEGDEEVKDFEVFIAEKQKEFNEFTEDLFQDKLPNSILLPIGIDRYNEAEKEIKAKNDLTFVHILRQTDLTTSEQFEKAGYCEAQMEVGLKRMYEPFEMHVKSTAQVKRTTILMDKYKHINKKLRDLNRVLAETYGYYLTFQKKFKDFVPSCEK